MVLVHGLSCLSYGPVSLPRLDRRRCVCHKSCARLAAHIVRAVNSPDPPAGADLARDFSKFVNETGAVTPLKTRRPSHLLPPTAAIAAQLDALQLNDWPERGAGIHTAFMFSKPYGCESMITGPALPDQARSWYGKEAWLSLEEFTSMLQSVEYRPLINCESWQVSLGAEVHWTHSVSHLLTSPWRF
ncbi:hypothetical protein ABBQ38_011651 [Trebouxia sp. C0009 RCD-2024]